VQSKNFSTEQPNIYIKFFQSDVNER